MMYMLGGLWGRPFCTTGGSDMKHDHRTHVIWHMTISQNGNVTGGEGKPLCMDSRVEEYHPEEVKKHDGILWMHYRRN